MIIEINTDKLGKLGLSPNDYVYLYCICNKLPVVCLFDSSSNLERLGFVKITGEEGIMPRERAYELFEIKDEVKSWIEFFMEFPMKVQSSGGTRPLRPSTLEAKANDATKKKYLSIIKGKPDLHNTIVKILKAEIDMRRRTNSLQFMNAIDAWINQRKWEYYSYLLDQEVEPDKTEGVNK